MKARGFLPTYWFPALLFITPCVVFATEDDGRPSFWIDLYRGEPVAYENMLDDLSGVRVIYIGECHSLERHHDIQARIIADLGQRGLPLVLGLEQMEFFQQAGLDRYHQGEINFDQLAEETRWPQRWRNYQQYRSILEAARKCGVPILALNARSIHQFLMVDLVLSAGIKFPITTP